MKKQIGLLYKSGYKELEFDFFFSDNVALQLGKLEQRLLLSNSNTDLENILAQLHRLGPGKHYSNINSKVSTN